MTMTKKDFKILVQQLNKMFMELEIKGIHLTEELILKHTIQFCKTQNPLFNEDTFRDYLSYIKEN